MSQTFVEETLDETIVARGGSNVNPQLSLVADVSSIGLLTSGQVLSPEVSQMPDTHANSTAITGGARVALNTPPDVDVFHIPSMDDPSIPAVTIQVLTNPLGSRSDLTNLEPREGRSDISPMNDKLGNLSIIVHTQQGDIGDIVSPDVVEVDPNSRVESGDEHGATAKPLPQDLGPFSRIHDDYKLPKYHPSVEVRKRANRNISKIFKMFAHLLRTNGMRKVEYYIVIHQMTSVELDNLLKSCKLASWRICNKSESSFEGRWHICLSMTNALRQITASQYMECVTLATIHYPVAWSRVVLILENMKKYPGYNFSPLDSYQNMSASIFQINEYYSEKLYGLMGMVNSILKIRTFREELVRATSDPYDADFLTDVETFWKNETIPEEFINECRTFLN